MWCHFGRVAAGMALRFLSPLLQVSIPARACTHQPVRLSVLTPIGRSLHERETAIQAHKQLQINQPARVRDVFESNLHVQAHSRRHDVCPTLHHNRQQRMQNDRKFSRSIKLSGDILAHQHISFGQRTELNKKNTRHAEQLQ